MKHKHFGHRGEQDHTRQQPLEWLIYLPGAFIIAYGLWLSVTATG
jgi:hypothetical protein